MEYYAGNNYCNLFELISVRGLRRDAVSVELSACHNRIKPKNEELELSIEHIWNRVKETKTLVFNGTKFRYAGHVWDSDRQNLCFKLGITDFKTYIGTNASDKAMQYFEMGVLDFGNYNAYLGSPLGVGAIVETNDNKVAFIKRSQIVFDSKGMIDVIGGHAEPMNLVGKIPTEEINIQKLDPIAVVNEIFNSIIHEVRDEINIPEERLDDPLLIGINGDKKNANKATAEFFIRCNLSSDEVMELYNKGTQNEANETTGILFMTLSELSNIYDKELFCNMTPSAKGAIEMYLKSTKLFSK